MMLKVGVTGGIGSGKSTVSRAFEALGVPVYYTDPKAKEIMMSDPRISEGITALLGPEAYVDGRLNRPFVASKIFNDRSLIREVNGIVHPRVAADFLRWAEEMAGSGAPYIMMECAILFESGFDRLVDRVVTVSADLEERVGRASSRDNNDEEHIRVRMAHQMTDEQRERKAGYVIRNSDHDMVLPVILELHKRFTDEGRK